MIDYEEEIIEFQKWYMEVMSDIRSSNMFTFPVSTISLLRQNGKFVDEEFAKWAVKHNMKWSDSNLFIDETVNSLSNCCRLKSNIADLGYFNSIGGTALKVGSVKVNTINLARIALDTNTEEEYLEELKKRTYICLCALDAVRHTIRRNVEKGILPNFSYGLIDFEHLYNTIGFIGVYESMKKFGYTKVDEFGNTYYTKEASAFGEKIFKTMRKVADDFIKEYSCDYQINTFLFMVISLFLLVLKLHFKKELELPLNLIVIVMVAAYSIVMLMHHLTVLRKHGKWLIILQTSI